MLQKGVEENEEDGVPNTKSSTSLTVGFFLEEPYILVKIARSHKEKVNSLKCLTPLC